MPAQSLEPPKLNHVAPDWFKEVWEAMRRWLISQRVVAGLNVTITDAPGGGLMVNAQSGGRRGTGIYSPFEIIPYTPPGHTGKGWVYVNLNSWLLKDLNPTNTITITGLGKLGAFQLSSGKRVWLDINLAPTYTGGLPIASIQHGTDWGLVFPETVEYNTDDGTRLGSSGSPPDNTHQTKIYIPIGYTESADDDTFGIIDAGQAVLLFDKISVIQQLSQHLIMGGTCYGGGQATYAVPAPFAPQP